MRARDVFMAALEAKDPGERNRILTEQCQGDVGLRREVELLLQQHERDETFILDAAPADLDATGAVEMLERAGSIVGPYKILQEIGEGGMGVVFMAEQSSPIQRMVALKIIKPGMDSRQVIARFEAERQTLALMDHPNIARVLDAGTSPHGRPYFVMELVKGLPITKYCDEHHLTVAERLELFKSVCQAVQHAHQKGVIHRDIKPSNVLVAEYDHQAVPKIIDFGVAKAMGFKLTERTMFTGLGQVLGTLEYMSPEQAKLNQLDIDTRSDIYSLGVLLYELLTGSTPFERKRLREAAYDEVLRIIREEEPPKPSTRVSTAAELPAIANNRGAEPKKLSVLMRGELDWVVMRALEKDRNRRYETANGLAMDIQRYLAGEPVAAHPPSAAYRLKKFLRKRRGPVAAATLLLLALVGGIVGTTIGMFRANRAETKAIQDRDAALAARKETFEVLTDLTDNSVGTLLVQNPVLSPTQREFLERIVARYERLAEGMSADADTASMQARCLEQVGHTYMLLGDFQRAVDVLEQAESTLRQLMLDHPDDPQWVERLVDSLNNRGVAFDRMQQTEKSYETHEDAIAIAEQGLERFPNHKDIALSLAILYRNRATDDGSDPSTRESDIGRSIEIARGLAKSKDAGPVERRTLAVCLSMLAAYRAEQNDLDQVRATLDEIESLVEGVGLDGEHILGLAYWDFAAALKNTNQREAAIAAYRIGIQHMETHLASNPGDSLTISSLIGICKTLEQLLRYAGRDEEATVYYRRANALAERAIERADGEIASLGTYIDLNAAVARSHLAAGRDVELNDTVQKLVDIGRKLIEARPNPLIEDGLVDIADAKRQSHRLRQLVDACNDTRRFEDAIFFGKHQEKFVQAMIAQGEPMTEEAFTLLHSTHWGLARAYRSAARFEEARTHWEKMVQVTAWDEPGNAKEDAIQFISDTSRQLTAAGLTADPVAVLGPQIDERQSQFAERPDDLPLRTKLLRAHRVLGLTLEFLHRFDEAVQWNQKAIDMMGTPLPLHNALTQMDAEHLSQLVLGQAVCLDALGDESKAKDAWEISRAFSGERFKEFEFFSRAGKMARNGQGENGVRLIDKQLATAGADLRLRYNAACVYALASADQDVTPERSQELARRAIQLLKECREQKFFEDAGQRANVRSDADLAAIRESEEFQKFLSELTANSTGK